MKRSSSQPDVTTNDDQEGGQVSLESVIRVMFGSCTTGSAEAEPNGCTNPEPVSKKEKHKIVPEPPSPTRPDESMYTKIFSDEQLRAEEAVSHLREQLQQQRRTDTSPLRQAPEHSAKTVPRLFPVSSPQRRKDVAFFKPESTKKAEPALPTNAQKKVNENISFDDGISAISQHTLDDIAKMYEGENSFLQRVHSDITQDPAEPADESWKLTVRPTREASSPFRQRGAMGSFSLTRQGRSHGTSHTKQSRATKSTMSTQTNEFASVFRKDEQKYWHDIVEEQEKDSPVPVSPKSPTKHDKLMKARDRFRRKRSGEVVSTSRQ